MSIFIQDLFAACRRGSFFQVRDMLRNDAIAPQKVLEINAQDDGSSLAPPQNSDDASEDAVEEKESVVIASAKPPAKTAQVNIGPGMTALAWAAYYGHAGLVEMLLREYHADAEIRDAVYDRTPLIWAAGFGYIRCVELLLDVGKAKLEAKDKRGSTALDVAEQYSQTKVASLLRARQAQLAEENKFKIRNRSKSLRKIRSNSIF